MSFRIENLSALARGIDRLTRLADEGAKIKARAISTLKRRLPAQAKRDIGAQYNLPSRQIGSRLRCSGDGTSVTLTGLGRAQTLIKFGAKQNAAGVAVQVEKGKSLQIQHAFIRVPAGAPSAGPQVMIRDAEFGSIPNAKVQDIAIVDHNRHGYPIVLLGGPSVADMLRDPGREDRLTNFTQTVFAAEVDRLAEVARNGK